MWLQQARATRRLNIPNLSSEANSADLMTKPVGFDRIRKFLGCLGSIYVNEDEALTTAANYS